MAIFHPLKTPKRKKGKERWLSCTWKQTGKKGKGCYQWTAFFTSPEELVTFSVRKGKKEMGNTDHFQLLTKRVHYISLVHLLFEVTNQSGPSPTGDGNMEIEEFYRILGLKGTVKILKCLNEHEKARYIDLSSIISYASLNTRLTELETLYLIEHHFNRGKEKREEWYELTEKGKKLILIFNQLEEIINE